jgi:hypothetical protein
MSRLPAALALLVAVTAATGTAAPASAAGIVSFEVSGSTVSAALGVPGGVGADLTITFDQALGLSADSLGLSADLVQASQLVGRLPAGVSLPTAFPLLLTVAPPADGPLSFAGLVSIELHTHNLSYSANSPLRLFRAEDGGSFADVTRSMGQGSYRVRGSTGDFCEFLIVSDTRNLDGVIQGKFSTLQSALDDALVPDAIVASLQSAIDAAWGAYRARSYVAAIASLEELDELVSEASGVAIPNVWRSAGDLANTAGELRAAAATLRFSLDLRASSGSL